ncbi:MAG: Fic family protein [Bacilli bacterium]|nr:Fic family protein [Bacilli bacterium]
MTFKYKEETITISGFQFPKRLFDKLMRNYAEAFAHTSLSCELAFDELENYEREINKLTNTNSREKYEKLKHNDKKHIKARLRFIIMYLVNKYGITKVNLDNAMEIRAIYKRDFNYFDDYIYDAIVFDENNKFDENATARIIMKLFQLVPQRNVAYDKAHNMRKDHVEAFKYALNLDSININSIIKINEIVNQSQDDVDSGFKRVNNCIIGSSFETCSKEEVRNKIIQLIDNYHNLFKDDIAGVDINSLDRDERKKYVLRLCYREAFFHIEFERIHPFGDGNGRTGRIILNTNLIRNGLTPIFVNSGAEELYKKFIQEKNYNGLAEHIYLLISQTLPTYISELREYDNINNTDLATALIKKRKPIR